MNKKEILKRVNEAINNDPWNSMLWYYMLGEVNDKITRTRIACLMNCLLCILFVYDENSSIFYVDVECSEKNNTSKIIDQHKLVVDCTLKEQNTYMSFRITFGAKEPHMGLFGEPQIKVYERKVKK